MAKTAEQKDWSPARLRKAVTAGTDAEKIAVLKQIGVLTRNGTLSRRTQNWGKKPTRTPELDE